MTPFAVLAKSPEAAGIDGKDGLLGGIMEVPWDKRGCFGSFSVPVMAQYAPGFISIDTEAAWKARGETGSLFPGWVRVTWVLDTKPSAGR